MSRLKHKMCELDGKDVDVYYSQMPPQQGDWLTPTYDAYTSIEIVEENGIEIDTTNEQDEYLKTQLN